MQFLSEIKSKLLQLVGKNEAIEKAENASELNTALDRVSDSISKRVTTEILALGESLSKDLTAKLENYKNDLNMLTKQTEDFSAKVSTLEKELASVKASQVQPGIAAAIATVETPKAKTTEKIDLVAAAGVKPRKRLF